MLVKPSISVQYNEIYYNGSILLKIAANNLVDMYANGQMKIWKLRVIARLTFPNVAVQKVSRNKFLFNKIDTPINVNARLQ